MWPPGHTPQRYDDIPEGLFYEETSAEELDSIATDWTLAIDKNLSANCRYKTNLVYSSTRLGSHYFLLCFGNLALRLPEQRVTNGME